LVCTSADGVCSPGVLPEGQNSPQKVKYELYAEGVRPQLDFG
jgi:homogentisate 1,2-dioxygenase